MQSLKFAGWQQSKAGARSFAIRKGWILPSWATCDSCVWYQQDMRYHIWSSNATSYRKAIFMALSLPYFLFPLLNACWIWHMISDQDLLNVKMVHITSWKIFLNLMNLHILIFFISVQSILILLEQRVTENNFVFVLLEKMQSFITPYGFLSCNVSPFCMREMLNRSTGYFIWIRVIVLQPLMYSFLFCL